VEISENKKKVKDRIKEIEKEIGEYKETTSNLETKWNNEKEALGEISRLKKELEEVRVEADNAEAIADLTRAAEIRYDIIP
jgi:ATP-dependent Clp protease ATP-binding subunit ClpB